MVELLLTMLERLGIIVMIAFVLTRLSFFREMIYRDHLNNDQRIKAILFFSFFGIIGTYSGVAFNSASGQYNVWAFDLANEEAISETVSRLEKTLMPKRKIRASHSSKFAVEREGEIFYLNPHDILYVTREEKTSKIVTLDHEYEVKAPIKELEARFDNYPFFRIHKSFLVHLDYVQKLTPWFNGAYQLELKGRSEVLSVSRNYVKELRQRLEL